jgi:hypothetical protein
MTIQTEKNFEAKKRTGNVASDSEKGQEKGCGPAIRVAGYPKLFSPANGGTYLDNGGIHKS